MNPGCCIVFQLLNYTLLGLVRPVTSFSVCPKRSEVGCQVSGGAVVLQRRWVSTRGSWALLQTGVPEGGALRLGSQWLPLNTPALVQLFPFTSCSELRTHSRSLLVWGPKCFANRRWVVCACMLSLVGFIGCSYSRLLMSRNGPYLVKEISWVASGDAGWLCQAARTPAAGRSGMELSWGAGASWFICFY